MAEGGAGRGAGTVPEGAVVGPVSAMEGGGDGHLRARMAEQRTVGLTFETSLGAGSRQNSE